MSARQAVGLHEAAQRQDRWQRLIDAYRAGESLDARDPRGRTPLHAALACVVRSVVLPTPAFTLLALGAAPDLVDDEGVRPVHLACRGKKGDALRLLLALGADPEAPDGAGRSPRDHFEGGGGGGVLDARVANALLAGGRGRLGRAGATTSLVEAARHDVPLAVVLLREGRDPRERDPEGATALHTTRSTALVAALLALGADPSATDARGRTPLHVACAGLGREITVLLDNGADPTLRDAEGRRAVDLLVAQEHPPDVYDGDRRQSVRDDFIRQVEEATARLTR